MKTIPSDQQGQMRISGRTSRDKSIINVLIFGTGHVLHHPSTSLWIRETGNAEDYRLKESMASENRLAEYRHARHISRRMSREKIQSRSGKTGTDLNGNAA